MNVRSMAKARLMKLVRYAGSWGVGALLTPVLGACGGEARSDVADGTGGDEGGYVASAEECADQEAQLQEPHDLWLATTNDFGELSGSRWQGTMKDLPTLVLELRADQTGTLQVGTPLPAPTERDQGYLEVAVPYPIGSTVPLHGGSFDGSELLLPLPMAAPYDTWCALQPPVSTQSSYYPCSFALSSGIDCTAGTTCDLSNGRTVERAWMDSVEACVCTSKECFAGFFWPEWEAGKTFADLENYYDLPVLRLRYDAETDTLEGGHFPEGSPPPAGSEGIRAKFVRAE
jgi:hypothetical protein